MLWQLISSAELQVNLPKMAANSSRSNVNSPKSECKIDDTGRSDELDHVPLIRRRKLLLANKKKSKSLIDVAVKEEDDEVSDSQDVLSFPFSAREVGVQLSEQEKRGGTPELLCSKSAVDSSVDQCLQNDACSQHVEMPGDCDYNREKVNTSEQLDCTESNIGDIQLEKIDVNICSQPENPTLSEVHAEVKVVYSENLSSSYGDGMNAFVGSPGPAVEVKSENSDNSTFDHLDHIVLKERQRMLLSRKERNTLILFSMAFRRKLLGLEKAVLEGIPGPFSEDLMQQHVGKGNRNNICGGKALVAASQLYDIPGRNASVRRTSMISSPNKSIVESSLTTDRCSLDLTKSNNDRKSSESDRICSSEGISPIAMELSPCGGQDDVPTCASKVCCSTLLTSVKMKDDPFDDSDFHNLGRNVRDNFSLNILPVKNEPMVFNELNEDEVDNMRLRDRLNLLASGEDSEVHMSKDYGCFVKIVPSSLKYRPIALESAKPASTSHPRKRKKTATASVETALEEDAPGLLQVLIDKGVLVNEIKLYGEMESDEPLDESFCEESFTKLEAVISKLFSQRQSLLKLAPIRCTKGSRASYCLACLISLVEQTRYLQFRNWPVEWGWCRDLQSFIFVFARHNRIVLERPEYGYATYFFEVVGSVPIDWQIKRLVTAMKLTSCSRISLIENKALTVGEDLTEGEAQVLMGYGWVPNTGLGTMLKYCDRVVHDRKNESDSSEWRSKIGKLLMDGYNGGTLITTNFPNKVLDCRDAQSPEIKLEL